MKMDKLYVTFNLRYELDHGVDVTETVALHNYRLIELYMYMWMQSHSLSVCVCVCVIRTRG